jgi:hypothetical protein
MHREKISQIANAGGERDSTVGISLPKLILLLLQESAADA